MGCGWLGCLSDCGLVNCELLAKANAGMPYRRSCRRLRSFEKVAPLSGLRQNRPSRKKKQQSDWNRAFLIIFNHFYF
jgi:hypothetical protein